ncbi:S8 family serine peptidase [Streptomyces uncialis]|uniref:S8 family serine peptidase n=1 Tax=Streptomyces uncialis TaxID=1048205 RepID=UPI003654A2B0
MARRTPGRRGRFAALTAGFMALPLLLGAAPAAVPPDPGGTEAAPPAFRDKTEPGLRAQLGSRERATFWVTLAEEADPSAARRARDKTAKGRTLLAAKQNHARETQAPLKALLDGAGVRHESFWVTNTLKVTADEALARKIAARPEVASLAADDPVVLPDPLPGDGKPRVNAVEWNIDRINAPRVWSEFGARGENVVVATIDSGVQLGHPALHDRYRGLKADGGYDHAYNWYDPGWVCGPTKPCDNTGHGTHVMGTMVGDGGPDHTIGVAPGATWIAAKGCEDTRCTRESLLRSGEWMIAPTDTNGLNPRPDLAPHIVNSSWGNSSSDPWFKPVVQAWRDAGIFPAMSSGNSGSQCQATGSPGGYATTYSSGAFDANNAIASFSARGSGEEGAVKPNLAAPGVDVRSAWSDGTYRPLSGTSMATPHTAATVALIWSAAPSLRGDVAETERLLNRTAIDTEDLSCGGTPERNNVWGEGRLDAHAAVSAAPRGPVGAVSGGVTSGGAPVADAVLDFVGPVKARAHGDAQGRYHAKRLAAGEYTVTVSAFGFTPVTGTATVTANGTVTRDFSLERAPAARLTGRVTGASGAERRAVVGVVDAPASATTAITGADGTFSLDLPQGTYDISASPDHRCAAVSTVRIEVRGNTVHDFRTPPRTDGFGTSCTVATDVPFPRGTKPITFPHTDRAVSTIDLPFPVPFYGRTHRSAAVSVDGALGFSELLHSGNNTLLPRAGVPDNALFPYWDDLVLGAGAGVHWAASGTAPHRTVTVEWRDVAPASSREVRFSFAAVIGEDGTASFHYENGPGAGLTNGESATIGVENPTGTDALMYSFNSSVVRGGKSVHFRTGDTAVLSGTVTDANDGKPVAGATVTAGGRTDTTGADGGYLFQLAPSAAQDLAVAAPHYTAATRQVRGEAGGVTVTDVALGTARITPEAASAHLVVPPGERRARDLTLTNTGSAGAYTLTEATDEPWLTVSPVGGELAAGGRTAVTVTADASGVAPGTVLTATLKLASDSGRKPVTDIPVTVVVPAYRTAVDAGAARALTDAHGDTWTPDRAYTAGSHGHLGAGTRLTTNRALTGSPLHDPALYRTARQDMREYRFDGLPTGTYRVELGFAELAGKRPSQRVFDVTAEGKLVVPNLDLALEAGVRTAHDRAFTVRVTDGQLDLRFDRTAGRALVNAIRVTHRPDLTG